MLGNKIPQRWLLRENLREVKAAEYGPQMRCQCRELPPSVLAPTMVADNRKTKQRMCACNCIADDAFYLLLRSITE